MGMIARVLSFARVIRRNGAKASETKVDPGGGANVTAEHYGAPGDDAAPLPGDYTVTVATTRSGGMAAVGYIDARNAGIAQPGDKRIYSRDSSGAVKAAMWLQSDGSVIITNEGGAILSLSASGNITLTGGTVTINGVTIDATGKITTPADVVAGPLAVSLLLHKHNIIAPLPGTPTTPAIP